MVAKKDGLSGSSGRPRRESGNAGARDGDVGEALRTVYGDTLKEEIPTEMLALLGKLD